MAQQRLQLNLTANTSGFTGALNTASSKLQKFGGKLKSIGGSMQKFALPLALAGGASVKMALDFDKSLTKIQALVGVASKDVQKLGEGAKNMARDVGISSREAADALFFITSAGIKDTSKALHTLEFASKAAASGLGETKTIADLTTSAMNAYGQDVLSAEHATDVLTASVREGKLEAGELAGAMGAVIPLASNMGVSFDQVGAAMASMSRTGTNAAVGATQLTQILASLKKPTNEAEQAFASMGLSTQGVQQSLAEEGLMATLEMLKNKTTEFGVNITDIFPNIRALKGVLDLTGAGMEESKKIFDALADSAGSTAEAFRITEQSASFQFQKSLNNAKETLMSLGQQLMVAVVPAVQKLVGFIQNLYKRFTELDPTMQKLILALGGVAIALPTIITLVGSLVSLLGALLSPIGLVVAGLSAIAYVIYKNWGEVLPVVVGLYNRFVDLYNSSKFIRVAIAGIGSVFRGVFTKIKSYVDQFVNAWATMWNLIKEFSEKGFKGSFGDILEEGFDNAQTIASDAGKKIAKDFTDSYTNALSNSLEHKTVEQVQNSLDNVGNYIKDNVNSLFSGGGGGTSTTSTSGDTSAGNDTLIGSDTVLPTGGDDNKAIEEKITLLEKLGWTADSTAQSLQASFSHLGNSIVETMGVAGTALGEFLSNFMNMVTEYLAGQLQMMIADKQKATNKTTTDAMQMASDSALTAVLGANAASKISASGGASIGHAVEGAGQSAKSFGPLAAFVLPALIAMAVGAVSSAMKKTKKFAKGGIISAPTMGLMGEYPGARSNPEVVAPLDRLKGLIGTNNRTQQVNVGGSFELRGQDLVVALERANSTRDRIL
tara:strand:+ start:5905 stop:8406 length:2502 start_codon:yes stop_codon:yes gene_type:complete